MIDKSLAAQRDRIQMKRDQRAEEKKIADKKAAAKENQEKVQEKRKGKPEDMVTVEASSWDDLLQKINETITMSRTDMVQTQAETWVGQQFDTVI